VIDVDALAGELRAARDGREPPAGMLDVVADELAGVPFVRPADWDLLCERGRDSPFWAIVWPSGAALTEAVVAAPERFAGRRVLELGCGLGVPSAAAARAGARVLATDGSPEAVVFARHNLALAGGGTAAVLDVAGEPPGERFDVVMTADLLYDRRNVAPLLDLVPRVVVPGGEAWVADPGRPALDDLCRQAATRWPGVTLEVVRAPAPETNVRD
jgi:predicted nicotinamide N-methyase